MFSYVELSNGNLSNIRVNKPKTTDATLTINKTDITRILLGQTQLAELL